MLRYVNLHGYLDRLCNDRIADARSRSWRMGDHAYEDADVSALKSQHMRHARKDGVLARRRIASYAGSPCSTTRFAPTFNWSSPTHRPLVILNLPHPACFAREVRRPTQFLKSWYTLFFQLPWLPEKFLAAARAAALLNSSARPRAIPRFPDEVWKSTAPTRPTRWTHGHDQLVSWLFRSGGLQRFFGRDIPIIHIPTLFLWGDQTSRSAFALRSARRNTSLT